MIQMQMDGTDDTSSDIMKLYIRVVQVRCTYEKFKWLRHMHDHADIDHVQDECR